MPTATDKGYPYPLAGDPNNVPVDIQALAEAVDARPGVSPLTTQMRDALAGADLWDGRVIWNVTTGAIEGYRASDGTWQPVVRPATDPPTASAPGDAGAAGGSLLLARSDHRHAREAFGSPVGVGVGTASGDGAAGTLSRSDHVHGLATATPGASVPGDAASGGASASVSRSDHRHAREGFGAVVAQVAYGAAATNGAAGTLARSDHAHGTPPERLYVATSTTRPSGVTNRLLHETDTDLITTYKGAWRPLGWRALHEEWQTVLDNHSGAYSAPSVLTRDPSPQIGDTGRITSPGAGQIAISGSGRTEIWAIQFIGSYNATLAGRSFIEIDFWNGSAWEPMAKANIAEGDLRASVSVPNFHVASDGRTLCLFIFHQTGATRNFTGRVRLSRMLVG